MNAQPTQPHAIEFRVEPGWLVAELGGWIDSVEPLAALLRAGAEKLQETRSRKLLVLDHSRGVVPPEAEMRRLLAAVEGSGLVRARIAWVDSSKKSGAKTAARSATRAQNRAPASKGSSVVADRARSASCSERSTASTTAPSRPLRDPKW